MGEHNLPTTPKGIDELFRRIPRSRIALETGTHSPWASRQLARLGHEVIVAHARNVRLIGESSRRRSIDGEPGNFTDSFRFDFVVDFRRTHVVHSMVAAPTFPLGTPGVSVGEHEVSLVLKMIIVERQPGEFCEIFQEEYQPGEVLCDTRIFY